MIKHTQTIHWLLPINCLSVFDHFVGLALKYFKHSIQIVPMFPFTLTLSVILWQYCNVLESKNSHRRCSIKKDVLENFAKFTRKHMFRSIRPTTLLKKRLQHICFPVNFSRFLRAPFFIELLQWLFLKRFAIGMK